MHDFVTLLLHMTTNIHHLYTALEAEDILGKKYFYRQRIYRLAEDKKIISFNRQQAGVVYLGSHIIQTFLKELNLKIQNKFPEINIESIRIFYDTVSGKRIVIDGLFGRSISINTDEENEEDVIQKINGILDWIKADADITQNVESEPEVIAETELDDPIEDTKDSKAISLTEVLPEEILWVRVDTATIEDVEIKSYILISLPSIAQFIGMKASNFIRWISGTTFSEYVLSAHAKQIQGTQNRVPWKRGVVAGFVSFIPFELLPEVIVAYKQTNAAPPYPEKADMLYKLAEKTLQAVGIAISGDKEKAAEELAKVGLGLGINAADQIIGVFKQYESREFQIKTTKEFQSKVKEQKMDYAATIGTLTLEITGKWPSQWKTFGVSRQLPKTITDSSREVMRKLSPSNGVGMTFGEKHFTKDANVTEAVKTGRQGKDFYERLKKVGLLD